MSDIRIIIADDHTVVRKGTRQILEQEPDFKVVGEAANGEEAMQLVTTLKPDVAIIDIAMPVLDGIQATKRIKETNPSTAVLILSTYDNDEYVFALLEAGAAGYLLKDVSGQDIINAVRAINRGESVLHPVIARKVMNRFVLAPKVKKENPKILADREMEVLSLAGESLSNQEIADKLGLSLHTIEAHMRHIFSKLQVSSRTEAVLYALKQGWISIDGPKIARTFYPLIVRLQKLAIWFYQIKPSDAISSVCKIIFLFRMLFICFIKSLDVYFFYIIVIEYHYLKYVYDVDRINVMQYYWQQTILENHYIAQDFRLKNFFNIAHKLKIKYKDFQEVAKTLYRSD